MLISAIQQSDSVIHICTFLSYILFNYGLFLSSLDSWTWGVTSPRQPPAVRVSSSLRVIQGDSAPECHCLAICENQPGNAFILKLRDPNLEYIKFSNSLKFKSLKLHFLIILSVWVYVQTYIPYLFYKDKNYHIMVTGYILRPIILDSKLARLCFLSSVWNLLCTRTLPSIYLHFTNITHAHSFWGFKK